MSVVVDGSGDYIRRTANLPAQTGWTACGWFRTLSQTTPVYHFVLCLSNSASNGDGQILLGWDSGVFALTRTVSLGDWDIDTFPTDPGDNQWFFGAIRASGTGIGGVSGSIFRNGSSTALETVTNSTGVVTFTPAGFFVGSDGYSGEEHDGNQCAIKLWDAILTDAELYNEMLFYRALRRADLRYEWPLLDASDTRDLSGNGYAPSFNGAATSADGPPIVWAPKPRILLAPFVAGGGGGQTGDFAGASTFGASFSAVAAAQAALTAGVSAGFTGGGAAASLGTLSAGATISAELSAVAAALAAIEAGLSAGEAWAAQASALAGLSAGADIDAVFDGDTEGAETAALTAGTSAAAQFVGAVAALGLLQAGASVSEAWAAQAQCVGALQAGASIDADFSALGGDDGDVSAPTSVSAVFAGVAATYAGLVGASSASSLFAGAAVSLAAVVAAVSIDDTWAAVSSADGAPPVKQIVRVVRQIRTLRASRSSRIVRVH